MPYDWRLLLGMVVLLIISVLTYYGWQQEDSDSSDDESSDSEDETVESFADMILTEDIVSDPSKYRLTETIIYFTNDTKECDASGSLSPKFIANLKHPLFEINYDWNVAWYQALYNAVRRLYIKTRKPLVLLVMSDVERVLKNYRKFADGKFCKINIPRWRFFNRSDENILLGDLKSNKARGPAIHWATLGRTDVLRGEIDQHGLHVPKDREGDYFYIWKDGVRYARGTLPNFRPNTVKKLYCAERGLRSDARIGSALQYDPYTNKVVFTRNMKKAKPETHEVLFFLSWLTDVEYNSQTYNTVVTESRTVALPVTRYVKDPCGTWRAVRTSVMMRVQFQKQAVLKQILRNASTTFFQGNTSSLMNSQNVLVGRIADGTVEAAGLVSERVALTKRLTEVDTQIRHYRKVIGAYETEMKARSAVKMVGKVLKTIGRGIIRAGKAYIKYKRPAYKYNYSMPRREGFADYSDSDKEDFTDYSDSDREDFTDSESDVEGYMDYESDAESFVEGYTDYESDAESFEGDTMEGFKGKPSIKKATKAINKATKKAAAKTAKATKKAAAKTAKATKKAAAKTAKATKKAAAKTAKKIKNSKLGKKVAKVAKKAAKKVPFKKLQKALSKGGPIAKVGKKTIKKVGKKALKAIKKVAKKTFRRVRSVASARENKRKLQELKLKISAARNELRKLEILRVAITTALQQNILQNFNLNTQLNRYNSFKGIVNNLHWDVLMKMQKYVIEELEAGRITVTGAPDRGDLPQEHLKHLSDDGKIYITF